MGGRQKSLEARLAALSLGESRRKFTPVKVTKNPDMVMNFLYLATGNRCWFDADYSVPFVQVKLKRKSRQYKLVEDLFDDTNEDDYIIDVYRVDNPFLLAQYLLKVAYKRRFDLDGPTKVRTLFHGTKGGYVDSICKTNLDWRRMGLTGFKANKYGNGVSFSPSSLYASRFPRGDTATPRVMLLCNVLVHSATVGNAKTKIPPNDGDATGSADGEVIVKYDDNEFYPKYVIYYEEMEDSSSDSYY